MELNRIAVDPRPPRCSCTAGSRGARRIILTGEGMGMAHIVREHIDRGIRRDRDPRASDLEIQPSDFAKNARGAAVIAIQSHVLGLG